MYYFITIKHIKSMKLQSILESILIIYSTLSHCQSVAAIFILDVDVKLECLSWWIISILLNICKISKKKCETENNKLYINIVHVRIFLIFHQFSTTFIRIPKFRKIIYFGSSNYYYIYLDLSINYSFILISVHNGN